jgi:hypothetical protein
VSDADQRLGLEVAGSLTHWHHPVNGGE